MIEKISMTTRNYVSMIDDADEPFETADTDSLIVKWLVYDPEFGRLPEIDRWKSHDWTNDYDNDEDFE